MKYDSKQMENAAVLTTAQHMCAAARTAPKAKGWDYIDAIVLTDADKDAIAEKMDEICKREDIAFFARDAQNVRDSSALVFIAVKKSVRKLNCGFCGFPHCADLLKTDAKCFYDGVDLGIAIGSAVSIAADERVDNRILYSAGRAAMELNLFTEPVTAFGIALSVSGKNRFFDRK